MVTWIRLAQAVPRGRELASDSKSPRHTRVANQSNSPHWDGRTSNQILLFHIMLRVLLFIIHDTAWLFTDSLFPLSK